MTSKLDAHTANTQQAAHRAAAITSLLRKGRDDTFWLRSVALFLIGDIRGNCE